MLPKLSIIIPVYNVEDFLYQCLDSISSQSFKDFEAIIINDGSTDNSKKICEDFCISDSRFKIINKENGGLSDARNFGIKNAVGKYLAFVDSDDYILETSFEYLINYAEEKDLDIINGCVYLLKDTILVEKYTEKYSKLDKIDNGINLMCNLMLENQFEQGVWSSIYKRDFIVLNNLFFKKGRLHEDTLWTPQVYLKAARAAKTECIIYNYRIRTNSITTKKDKTINGLHILETCSELLPIYLDLKEKEHRNILLNKLAETYLNGLYMIYQKSQNKKEYPIKFNQHLKYLKYSRNPRVVLRTLVLFLSLDLYIVMMNYFRNEKI